jgi:hypothetical protein
MARKPVLGTCHICRKHTKLSFEHIPPRAAFNNCPAVSKHIFELINKHPDNYLEEKGKKSQRGFGAYTLCEACNSKTGRWYGTAFAEWAHQGMDILEHACSQPSLYYRSHIFPLRVLKQIICMFFSITDNVFAYNHPDLVGFVLNKNKCYLNSDIRIFAYYNVGPHGRYIGGASIETIKPEEINRHTIENLVRQIQSDHEKGRVLSEIACIPLGYVMSFGSKAPDYRLADISCFAKYRYDDYTSIPLRLPVLSVDSKFPADYRNREQIIRDAAAHQSN